MSSPRLLVSPWPSRAIYVLLVSCLLLGSLPAVFAAPNSPPKSTCVQVVQEPAHPPKAPCVKEPPVVVQQPATPPKKTTCVKKPPKVVPEPAIPPKAPCVKEPPNSVQKPGIPPNTTCVKDPPKVIQKPVVNLPGSSSNTSHSESGFRSVAYFVNWGIYGRKYTPNDLPVEKLTHILYAFANVNPNSGKVNLTDPWSDVEQRYPTDSWNDKGTNLYGCTKQMYLLKKRNRHLKVLLSIGGWTYSPNFPKAVSTEAGRKNFAETAVQLMLDTGMDGLDIDWEYPKNDEEAQNFVRLLEAVQAKFKTIAGNRKFLLTIATSAGPDKLKILRLKEMDQYLDFINLMAYDYSGPWDSIAGHQANIRPSKNLTASTPFSTEAALNYYINTAGIRASKLVVGIPLYGRAFTNTDGPGTPFKGVGEGSWEKGIWDYKVLPQNGSQVFRSSIFEGGIGASWSYDSAKKLFISFDTVEMVAEKTQFIFDKQLGGAMWWEASGDRGGRNATMSGGSLMATFYENIRKLSRNGMEKTPNVLDYPESKYDNMKSGMSN
ncbi:Chitinase 4 [Ophidiomyces ophidiicola]|uniref:Chitinase 4 n=1 Tax=Ophidiomyces ophidiicola TaxID=1387563 RepID=UPI0020C3DE11|nr:Chitinase 4 [Ophidiomyces ophidiicola]KAI1911228.1 Chitinase 4 [Ophidiomyces ophidiicola]KAI1947881.1 Chitinase 4 [Ophidiomyces ophidiicola]KAI1956025.1 Chitinase 4 [Ophidiomyces ophidiicola]KAI1968745.1 Chitinase 4 [Ophidiomyces ophidiicola]KAI2018815.1 Chitinase 4 [Ophidiomyces ophidiicola]